MSAIEQVFEHGGFRFDVKAQPVMALVLPDDADEGTRRAWATVEMLGASPDLLAFPMARNKVRSWRVAVRAETTRPWAEVLDAPWPGEVNVTLRAAGSTATLVVHAAAELPAGTDMLEAMAERLGREGPIGVEAAAAFVEGSLDPEPVEAGRAATWLLGAVAWTTAAALSAWAARLGGWGRAGIVLAVVMLLGPLVAILDPRSFRGS